MQCMATSTGKMCSPLWPIIISKYSAVIALQIHVQIKCCEVSIKIDCWYTLLPPDRCAAALLQSSRRIVSCSEHVGQWKSFRSIGSLMGAGI